MQITVNEQAQQFYLAFDKWVPAVGHEIKVGEFRFCAIPLGDTINVSEVTSGVKVMSVPVSLDVEMVTATKEGSMRFFEVVGERLKNALEVMGDFEKQLAVIRNKAIERLGEMPSIETVDVE